MSEANVADPSRGEATGRHREIAEKYPAPGFRDAGLRVGGVLWGVGHYGSSWSSFASEENTGYRLFFNYDEVYPQNHVSRAYGLPLRCLQE